MRKYLLLFACIMMVSCNASYRWYTLQVFQSKPSPRVGMANENIKLIPLGISRGIFTSCSGDSCYLYAGKWKRSQSTLMLYPQYRFDRENPECLKKLVQADTMGMSDYRLDRVIPRKFRIRRRFLKEVTDYSRDSSANSKMSEKKFLPRRASPFSVD